ncbi:c-type cytochrome [Tabrizicola sp.]|uniref:c-type cytochrome n=1 Tax=Tabrizicola sp. TaxID=2005166 RepID=UPI002639BE1E|nr:c-type cytochrome [Tabrizicola sp.]MDM7932545.1 c-type cytochrome [Tabrizicola sp.]
MVKTFELAGLCALFTLTGGAAIQAQDASFGANIYKDYCVVCHGESGAGDGMVGVLFAQPPADLRLLARNNNGVFPAAQVIEAIYGRRSIQAHGQTEMPIWGDFFMSQTLESPTIDPKDAAMITQGRVLSVVSFLESLQVE